MQSPRGEPKEDRRQKDHEEDNSNDDRHTIQSSDLWPILGTGATKLQRLCHDLSTDLRCMTDKGLAGTAPAAPVVPVVPVVPSV